MGEVRHKAIPFSSSLITSPPPQVHSVVPLPPKVGSQVLQVVGSDLKYFLQPSILATQIGALDSSMEIIYFKI